MALKQNPGVTNSWAHITDLLINKWAIVEQGIARFLAIAVPVHLIITLLICLTVMNGGQRSITAAYYQATTASFLFMNPTVEFRAYGKTFEKTANEILDNENIAKVAAQQKKKFWLILVPTSVIYLSFFPLAKYLRRKDEERTAEKTIRGPQLITASELTREIKNYMDEEIKSAKVEGAPLPKPSRFSIGGIPIPYIVEVQNILLLGSPGMGKTVLLHQILAVIRAIRGKTVIIDIQGEFIQKWYDPSRGDKIFNPLDARGVLWTMFKEFKSFTDIIAFWMGVIPLPKSGSSNETFFNMAAQALGVGISLVCIANGTLTKSAFKHLAQSNAELMEKALDSVKAAARGHSFVEQPNSALAGSVRAVFSQYTAWLDLLPEGEGDFCLTDWLTDGQEGFLFLSAKEDVAVVLEPLLSLVIDLFSRKLLSLPTDRDRRLFFMLDEFGGIQRLSELTKFLTRGRQKGASMFLATQDISAVIAKYGKEGTDTLMTSIGTVVTFGLEGEATPEMMSKNFGKSEVSITKQTDVIGVDTKANITQTTDEKERILILPSEFKMMKPLEYFIRVKGYNPAKGKLKLEAVNRSPGQNNQDFIVRDGLDPATIIKNAALAAVMAEAVLAEASANNGSKLEKVEEKQGKKQEERQEEIVQKRGVEQTQESVKQLLQEEATETPMKCPDYLKQMAKTQTTRNITNIEFFD